jgi:dihydroorotase
MAEYDLLLRGGESSDPASGRRERADLAVSGSRVAAILPANSQATAKRIIDAGGRLVTPGLIDLHTHLGFEIHRLVLAPEAACPPGGVTAAVDMGSTGVFTFPWYRQRVLAGCPIRLYSFLNISALGTTAIHPPYYVEHYGAYIDVPEAIRTVEEHRDYIRGIKVFAAGQMVGEWALPAIAAAQEVAGATDLPIAVHVSQGPPSLDEIVERLRPGDILTHTFTPHDQGILDEAGRVRPAVLRARERGVWFDVGHGAGSFSYRVAERALAQGFVPDSISTDLYADNIGGPVVSLLTTAEKFLMLGLALEEVLARITVRPARAIGAVELGSLAVGAPADLAVLELRDEAHPLTDAPGEIRLAPQRLICHLTVANGRVIYERAASPAAG